MWIETKNGMKLQSVLISGVMIRVVERSVERSGERSGEEFEPVVELVVEMVNGKTYVIESGTPQRCEEVMKQMCDAFGYESWSPSGIYPKKKGVMNL